MEDIKIGVVGCAGRMGRANLACILASDGAALAGGSEQPDSPWVGRDIGLLVEGTPLGLAVGADPAAIFATADVVVDFTVPAASLGHAALAAETGTALVLGTTGLSADAQARIQTAAERAPILQAANMSMGVTLLLGLVEEAARALDDDWDIEVLDMHHRHKVDAPSGTALALGRAAAAGRGVSLEAVGQRVRDGITGPRPKGEIGFATLRGGDVPGEHGVIFAAEGERVEIVHKAGSREIFARGAIRAALWLAGRPPGLYSMRDVLGLS